jgi:hypothetical protein
MRLNKELIKKSSILETIIQKIEKDFSQDISVLVCYGSFVKGTQHKYSDIDFFFIPKTKKGYNLSFQFIINEIGYDLWPISWNRAEEIVMLKDPLQSLFQEGVILYFDTEEDRARYKDLVSKARTNLEEVIPSKSKQNSPQADLIGFYEELKSIYNKIKIACETENYELACSSAKMVDQETADTLTHFAKEFAFPLLLVSVKTKEFEHILVDVQRHEKLLLKLLKERKVPLNIFKTKKEFQVAFLKR